jgi:hypothetical protein
LAAIKNADHLSKLSGRMFWVLIITHLVFTTACLIVALRIIRAKSDGDGDRPANPKSADNKESSPLATLFSLVVLSWAVVLVLYRPEPTKEPTKETPTHSASPRPVSNPYPVRQLGPVPIFPKSLPASLSDNSPEPEEIGPLRQALQDANPKSGDVLLLLGSADCTPFRGNEKREKNTKDANSELAERRAKTVGNRQEPTAEKLGVVIRSKALQQHSSCKEAPDLRGVYSFLIRSANLGH